MKHLGTILKVGLGGIFALGAGGFALYTMWQTNKNVVFFDNTHEVQVVVSVAGEEYTLQPGEAAIVEMEEGSHEVVATGADGAELSRESINVGGDAFRGLYDLAGKGNYMVVTAHFSTAGGNTSYDPLPPGQTFYTLPSGTIREAMDMNIPMEVSTSGGSVTQIYLCHFDPTTEAIGCPNA